MTVSAEMKLSVTVTSENYTEELQNWSSPEFKKFNDLFTKQVGLGEQVPIATQISPERDL